MATTNVTPLKKILFANIEKVIFTISTSITSSVLILCSIYLFFLLISGGFMTCFIPGVYSPDGKVQETNQKFCFTARSTNWRNLNREDVKEIVKHDVYVWTPYILIVQAILFYLPKYFLTFFERGTFEMAMFSFVKLQTSSKDNKRKLNLSQAHNDFSDRLLGRRYFAVGLIFCEFINVVILTLHIYAMKVYLGMKFYEDEYSGNSFDEVFPKSLQCAYHGVVRQNGTTANNNVVTCDMPINYVNETIYTYLWIYSNLLLGLATLVILYRLLSMYLYRRSNAYNRFEFERVSCGPMKQGNLMVVAFWGYPRWLTLRRLARELNRETFCQLIGILEKRLAFESGPELSPLQ